MVARTVNFEPLNDNVLIEPILVKATPGGVVLPETIMQEGPDRATVVAVGPGRLNEAGERIPMPVEVGDVVYAMFALGGRNYGPMKITLDGRDYYCLTAGSILGKAKL